MQCHLEVEFVHGVCRIGAVENRGKSFLNCNPIVDLIRSATVHATNIELQIVRTYFQLNIEDPFQSNQDLKKKVYER